VIVAVSALAKCEMVTGSSLQQLLSTSKREYGDEHLTTYLCTVELLFSG